MVNSSKLQTKQKSSITSVKSKRNLKIISPIKLKAKKIISYNLHLNRSKILKSKLFILIKAPNFLILIQIMKLI